MDGVGVYVPEAALRRGRVRGQAPGSVHTMDDRGVSAAGQRGRLLAPPRVVPARALRRHDAAQLHAAVQKKPAQAGFLHPSLIWEARGTSD